MKAKVIQFRRGRHTIHKRHFLIEVEGVSDRAGAKKLVGKECLIPIINKTIPILAAKFTDPSIATGIVMSVPAHAPYDWIALRDSKKTIDPVVIIDLEGYQIPARDICKKMDIKSQNDTKEDSPSHHNLLGLKFILYIRKSRSFRTNTLALTCRQS